MSDLGGLVEAFVARFGAAPTRVVRAPGRVNLIGDHIDYNGLSVLPMAIQHEIRLLVAPRDDGQVRLANVDEAFEPVTFELGPRHPGVPRRPLGQLRAGGGAGARDRVRAARRRRRARHRRHPRAPPASARRPRWSLPPRSRSSTPTRSTSRRTRSWRSWPTPSHYVGTRGGGMDQAICLGARRGAATRIDFRPLRLTPVAIPGGWRFLVAFSGVRAAEVGGRARGVLTAARASAPTRCRSWRRPRVWGPRRRGRRSWPGRPSGTSPRRSPSWTRRSTGAPATCSPRRRASRRRSPRWPPRIPTRSDGR